MTAGYPRAEDTVSILLAMQEGGADIIELGVPFSDPMADGPAIQETNAVRLTQIFGQKPSLILYVIDRCEPECRLRILLGNSARST